MKKLRINFVRHADADKKREITPEGRMSAELAEKPAKLDFVFAANNGRSVETAMILAGLPEEKICADKTFNDFAKGNSIAVRLAEMIGFIVAHANSTGLEEVDALVVTSSNLIAALQFFNEGKQIPENLSELPIVPNLAGVEVVFSFREMTTMAPW